MISRKNIAYPPRTESTRQANFPDADPLQKVTIIPRGRSLGATEQMLSENRDRLDRLAEALLENETLSNEEVDDLLAAVSNT